MPVTTILQHQRDRERLTQLEPDLPMTDDDHDTSIQDSIQDVRIDWALAVEQHIRVSLLTEEEKAAAVGRWVAPDSTYRSTLLNGRPNSSCPDTKQAFSGMYNARKAIHTTSDRPITNEEAFVPPQVAPSDDHYTRQMPSSNYDSRPASHEMQQSTQISCASYETRHISSSDYRDGPLSPTSSVYEVARCAVNVLGIHIHGEAHNNNNAPQAVSNNRVNEQTAPRIYNTLQTPPSSHSSAQASPLNYDGGRVSPASHHTGHPSPVGWNSMQTCPDPHHAVVARNRERGQALVSRAEPPSGINRIVMIVQPQQQQQQQQQPSSFQPPRPQSAAARRRAMLKHSVTYTLPETMPQRYAAPQQPVVVHPSKTSHHVPPPQPPVIPQSTRTSRHTRSPRRVLTPRPAATPYPEIRPRPLAVVSQGMAAPQPPVVSQPAHAESAYSQPVYPQSVYSQPHCSKSCCVQPIYPQPACSRPRCSQPECSEVYRSQLTYTQSVAAPQETNESYTAATSRSLAASQSAKAPNQPAATRVATVPQGMTVPQPLVTSQQASTSRQPKISKRPKTLQPGHPQASGTRNTTVVSDGQREFERGVKEYFEGPRDRELRLRREALLRAQDQPPLHGPQESSIIGMTPSVGNKVVEHFMKHNPSAVAASRLSNTIPQETAVHYNSVLSWHAQNIQHSFPHGHPARYNGAGSTTAPSYGVPAPREEQSMEPADVYASGTPIPQQGQTTEDSLRRTHCSVLAPQDGAQSRPYSRSPHGKLDNGPNGHVDRSSVAQQQSVDEPGNRKAVTSFRGEIQEVSLMDWQTANKENLGRQTDIQVATRQDWQSANKECLGRQVEQRPQPQPVVQRAHYVIPDSQISVASASRNKTSANAKLLPKPCFKPSKSDGPPPRTQRPIRQKRVPIPAQAQEIKKSASQAQTSLVSGGVHKRRSSQAGRTTPPQAVMPQNTRPQTAIPQSVPQTMPPQSANPQTTLPPSRQGTRQPIHVSGSGMALTQEDVERWQDERRNPYRLPSFNDSFGDVIMSNCSTGAEKQTSSEHVGGIFSLNAYRIEACNFLHTPLAWSGQ
ncbi:hypothetical protein V8C42DRAFT_268175 [Trichoderma barbatum]